jgi:hypothetical protein
MPNILNQIFTFYDRLIGAFPEKAQVLISLLLIVFIILAFISMIKHGHWVFFLIFIILFPGGWPASLRVFDAIWLIIKFLLVRVQINL